MKLSSRSIAACFLLPFLMPQLLQAVGNNPLNTIDAIKTDQHSAGIKIEKAADGGQTLCSIHDGDFAVYKGFDFDSGVAAFQMHFATPRTGWVEVRLDSVTGPIMGKCPFASTGGWQSFVNVSCNVDNSQSGVRDVYLIFHGDTKAALLNVSRFVFLKSVVVPGQQAIDLSDRLDVVDNEPQAVKAWGMPETGFKDDFAEGKAWTLKGLAVENRALVHTGTVSGFAFTPEVYINKTDTGGEWRTLAEASLAVDVVADSSESRPGIGFTSKNGSQSIYVVLNPADDRLEAWRQLRNGRAVQIAIHPQPSTDHDKQAREAINSRPRIWHLNSGMRYRLQIDWSPYSNGLIAFLRDDKGATLTSFRTAIDLPAARRPLLLTSGGPAHFGNVVFDPTLDSWNFRWEWKKTPVLTPDVCNPAAWRGNDGKMYMMWRKFGADNYHGVVSSTDGLNWSRVTDEAIKCTGDMNVVIDPFGDGLLYITGGGGKMPWWTCDGKNYGVWNNSGKNVGDISGYCRIQEIIDTKRFPQLAPIAFSGSTYRFISFTEDWNRMPKPHTGIHLSNTLTNWVLAEPILLPPGDDFWGEKGNAIGAAIPLPDGNILVGSCSCTNAGYTGAPEPSNVSLIVDGKQPWKVLKKGILPDAPVSREGVWYEGPNFGTAYFYDEKSDTLFYYGGFHDYRIGVLRVRNFLHR